MNILLMTVQEKAKIENNNEEIFKERNNGKKFSEMTKDIKFKI